MAHTTVANTTSRPLLPHSHSASSFNSQQVASSASSASLVHRQAVFRQLTIAALSYSAPSALFFAERWHALDPHDERATYYLALSLSRTHRHIQAIWQLRQPISYVSQSTLDSDNNNPFRRAGVVGSRVTRPAVQGSLRCARLYAQCCLVLHRHKEGRDVLSKIMQAGTPLAPVDPLDAVDINHASVPVSQQPFAVELELARLARAAGEPERAIQSYRRVLEMNPWCWEAIEALSSAGAPADPDILFPTRVRPASTAAAANQSWSTSTSASSSATATAAVAPTTRPPGTLHPPPLGPSQTSAVNSSFSFGQASVAQPAALLKGKGVAEGLGFFTPGEAGSPVLANGAGKLKAAGGVFALGGGAAAANPAAGGIWRRPGVVTRPSDMSDMLSMDDSSSSFEASFYPSQPLSFAPNPTVIAHAQTAGSSLFTPPTATASATTIAPGVKRTRGGHASAAAQSAANSGHTYATPNDDDNRSQPPAAVNGRRVVRGVPASTGASSTSSTGNPDSKPHQRDMAAAPTRRSSRLSREASTGASSTASMASSGMALSRSQQTNASNTATRMSKKRSKAAAAGSGPAVLSDGGGGAGGPGSDGMSSSPAPSSPPPVSGVNNMGSTAAAAAASGPALQDAEDYAAAVTRSFARAMACAASYENGKSVEAVGTLPSEQRATWRAWICIGRAQMEMLEYEKAEKAFAQARLAAPHLLESMELYSTLLWHLRSSTQLSFLSQDLMLIAPKSSSAWIASGNVFSHLEDHATALKCFKRAAQIDQDCVYAYTLSGHECVVLEEWERALGFFREAVRRDPRRYNAWFGIGNVYMQTGKYRLAEYHFRKATEINPTNATLVCCVGTVLEKLGKRRDALELYERACVLAPESPAVRFKRVRILISLKQYDLAEVDLVALKDRAPNEFNVHFLLGKLYKLLGPSRHSDMLRHFAIAQDLEPRTASMIREQIEKDFGDSADDEGMDVDGRD